MAPALADGAGSPLYELFALAEILHAIRDNLKIELRDDIPEYFRELPKYQVLGNLSGAARSAGKRISHPGVQGSGQPDLDQAALSRAAGLSMVAYDNNALENQYLQGWLIQDRFMLQALSALPTNFCGPILISPA